MLSLLLKGTHHFQQWFPRYWHSNKCFPPFSWAPCCITPELSFDSKESQSFWNITFLTVYRGNSLRYLSQICPTNITVQRRKGRGGRKALSSTWLPLRLKSSAVGGNLSPGLKTQKGLLAAYSLEVCSKNYYWVLKLSHFYKVEAIVNSQVILTASIFTLVSNPAAVDL